MDGYAALDIGKTHSKLLVVDACGAPLALRQNVNARRSDAGRSVLDADGIEDWLLRQIADLARVVEFRAIIPVAHGAAAALVVDGRRAVPVLDYESQPPATVASTYDAQRDVFSETLSPRLPLGLNLGLQLHWQELLASDDWPGRATALLWPQYWAWRLSGEMASEVTSLGCHSDLWRPKETDFSALAKRRGWANRLGPLTNAGATLATLRPKLARSLGVAPDCRVLCGLHDSNAALLGAGDFAQSASGPFTLVSTGTWFVTLQARGHEPVRYDEKRDMLGNVDIEGRIVPSGRFMGGREYDLIVGGAPSVAATIDAARSIVRRGVMTRPAFVRGCGPYPDSPAGSVVGAIESEQELATLASLHLALMTDAVLRLIGASGPIVIEGRFANDAVYPAALAACRRQQSVHLIPAGAGLIRGAARLLCPSPPRGGDLVPVKPLDCDLDAYASRWRTAAESTVVRRSGDSLTG